VPFVVSKETTGIVSPLRADGTVDYVAALNDKYGKGVKTEENAFVGWLKVCGTGSEVMAEKGREKVLAMCGAELSDGVRWDTFGLYLKRRGVEDAEANRRLDDEMAAAGMLWEEKDFPYLAGYLKECGPFLDGTVEAFGRRRYWIPAVASDDRLAVNVRLPTIGRYRAAANSLCARATLRARAGDFEGFLADVMAAKRASRMLGSSATVIERLVGLAINGVANRAIGAAAGRGIFTAKQYEALGTALEEAGPMPGMVEAVEVNERWSSLDTVAEVAIKGEMRLESGDLYAGGGVDREWVDWNVVLKLVNAEYDAVVAALKKPDLQQMHAACKANADRRAEWGSDMQREEGETREAYTQRVARALIRQVVPSLERAEEMRREAAMQDEMLLVVLAAGRFRVEQGDWPHEVEELVPRHIKKMPEDIYGEGKPVGYRWSAGGVTVVSMGRKYGPAEAPSRREIVVGVR
jgi:hypothetical protein